MRPARTYLNAGRLGRQGSHQARLRGDPLVAVGCSEQTHPQASPPAGDRTKVEATAGDCGAVWRDSQFVFYCCQEELVPDCHLSARSTDFGYTEVATVLVLRDSLRRHLAATISLQRLKTSLVSRPGLKLGSKHDIYGTSVGVPPRLCYSAVVMSRR